MELTELCAELRNWFELKKLFGNFTVSGGSINIPEAQENQYYRIIGSVFNDGVHKYPETELVDESFDGAVWLMAIPQGVLDLLDDINSWENEYGASIKSPYTSESFGGYSYTKATGTSSSSPNSSSADYRSIFANRLNKWRKL